MINTYNESSLHKKFKIAAAEKYNGQTEQSIGQYICDVVAKDKTIVEIQTKSFTHICAKLTDLLKTHRVHLIHPIACETYIEYYDKNNRLLSRRKSPVKRSIYHIFDELTALHSILPHKNFSFEAVKTSVVKKRIKTDVPVQSANKKRRYKKDWLAFDTDIEKIGTRCVFRSVRDYVHLLPKNLPPQFTVKDVRTLISETTTPATLVAAEAPAATAAPATLAAAEAPAATVTAKQINEMLWLFRKLNFIARTGKRGNSFVYSRL